jgi:hypothetical protein
MCGHSRKQIVAAILRMSLPRTLTTHPKIFLANSVLLLFASNVARTLPAPDIFIEPACTAQALPLKRDAAAPSCHTSEWHSRRSSRPCLPAA